MVPNDSRSLAIGSRTPQLYIGPLIYKCLLKYTKIHVGNIHYKKKLVNSIFLHF